MLFVNAVRNVLTGVFDVTNCVLRVLDYIRQNITVVFVARAFDYSLRIMFCTNGPCTVRPFNILNFIFCILKQKELIHTPILSFLFTMLPMRKLNLHKTHRFVKFESIAT